MKMNNFWVTLYQFQGSFEVQTEGLVECWVWLGTAKLGYGQFYDGHSMWAAHRWSYTYLVGEIPDGLTIDHVKERGCRTTLCVNPAHLEPVTGEENARRARARLDGRCLQGHDDWRVTTYKTGRTQLRCRTCEREGQRARALTRRTRRDMVTT